MKRLVVIIIIIGISLKCTTKHTQVIADTYDKMAYEQKSEKNLEEYVFIEGRNKYLVTKKYYVSQKSLKSIKGSLLSRDYGPEFFFLSSKKLIDFNYRSYMKGFLGYKILLKQNNYTEQGVPLVDFWFSSCDSIANSCIEVLFSSFPRSSVSAEYSYDGTNFQKLTLEKSLFIPFILVGHIKLSRPIDKLFIKGDAEGLISKFPGLLNYQKFEDTLKLQ